MRRNPLIVAVALGALLVAATSAAGGGLFGYDATLPLNAAFGTPTTSDGIVRQPFAYDATESLRLDGIFVHPSSGGPWPLVIWSPGAGGDRTQQMPDATAAAKSGLASLLVDTPPLSNCRDGRADLESVVAYVVSRRRAIDLAQTLPNVDAKRLAAAGFSLGAEVTASLAGVDHRIAAFALKSGRGHLSGFARIVCASLGPKLGDYMATLAPVDPVRWSGSAVHASFLLQNGTQDDLTPRPDVLALYRSVHGAKELRWYPASHNLTAAASADRLRWLLARLGHPRERN
jgi:dienelactone hydrolase